MLLLPPSWIIAIPCCVVSHHHIITLVLVFKAVNGLAPSYLKELLHIHEPTRGLRSKDQSLLTVPFTRSSMVQSRAFKVVGPRLWNNLPGSLWNITSLPLFKNKLKTHLFTEYFGKLSKLDVFNL